MFAVEGIDDVVERLRKHGAEFVGEMIQFEDINHVHYWLCYLRSPEGIIVSLAEQSGDKLQADVAAPKRSAILRMDNVLIVVDDLEAAKSFFMELGFNLEGETTVEGPFVDRLIGLQDVHATLAVLQTPERHGRIELDKYHSPEAVRFGSDNVPMNTLGIRQLTVAINNIDEVVTRLRMHGAELIGEIVQYEDTRRLCYIRGPEGIIIALLEQPGL